MKPAGRRTAVRAGGTRRGRSSRAPAEGRFVARKIWGSRSTCVGGSVLSLRPGARIARAQAAARGCPSTESWLGNPAGQVRPRVHPAACAAAVALSHLEQAPAPWCGEKMGEW